MKIKGNDLEGMYAAPDHLVTCANPAPWLIEEVKIVHRPSWEKEWGIFIRNENSMWFHVEQCFIGTKEDCQKTMDMEL